MPLTGQPVGVAEDSISVSVKQQTKSFALTFKASCPEPAIVGFKVPHALYCPGTSKRFHKAGNCFENLQLLESRPTEAEEIQVFRDIAE
jgi:hypothetical protein